MLLDHLKNEEYLKKVMQLALMGKEFNEKYGVDYRIMIEQFKIPRGAPPQFQQDLINIPITAAQRPPRFVLILNEIKKHTGNNIQTAEAAQSTVNESIH